MGDGRGQPMLMGNFQCQGILVIWIKIGQGPIVLAVDVGGCCFDIFPLFCHISLLLPLAGR